MDIFDRILLGIILFVLLVLTIINSGQIGELKSAIEALSALRVKS